MSPLVLLSSRGSDLWPGVFSPSGLRSTTLLILLIARQLNADLLRRSLATGLALHFVDCCRSLPLAAPPSCLAVVWASPYRPQPGPLRCVGAAAATQALLLLAPSLPLAAPAAGSGLPALRS